MKKNFKVILIIIALVSVIFCVQYYFKEKTKHEQQRYNEIIKNVEKSLDKNTMVTFPIHNDYNCNNYIKGHHTSEGLIKNGYLKEIDMLDIDKKSYCKAVATSYLDDDCIMKYNIGISCKNFKSDNFDNQLYNDSVEWLNSYLN